MIDPANSNATPKKQRRVRYKGKNPRRFDEKYKEHNSVHYAEDVAKIIQSGKTPAGTHRPVLLQEVLEILGPQPGQIALDATLGYGGHAEEILKRIAPNGCLWGIDVDPIEIKRTEARLRSLGSGEGQLKVRRMNFAGISKVRAEAGSGFDLILADLGVSSMQMDDPARGFTFKREGPLDLRLNPERGEPASVLLRSLSEKEFEKLLVTNADEPYARGIAKAVFKCHKGITTTTALADAVRRALPRASSDAEEEERTRSIRRTFQALRIALNDEFLILEQFLRNLAGCLKANGKAVILTFHSGEDDRVVRSFKEGLASGVYADMGREAIRATPQEVYANPRVKSATLRWVRRGDPEGFFPAG